MVKKKFDFMSKEFIIGAIVVVLLIFFVSSNAAKPLEFKTAVNSQNIEFKGITLNPHWVSNIFTVSCVGQTKAYQFPNLSNKGQPSFNVVYLNTVAFYAPTFWQPISYVSCENDNGAIILKLNQTDSTITYTTVQYQ